jgi:hypothetical protein
MKIESSSISMSSKSTLFESFSEKQSLKTWKDNPKESNANSSNSGADTLDISGEAKSLFTQKNGGVSSTEIDGTDLSEADKRKIKLIEEFIKALTGKKIKIVIPERIKIDSGNAVQIPQKVSIKGTEQAPQEGASKVGWGLEYNSSTTIHEAQNMSFDSKGIIKTSDGKTIDFSLSVNVSREFIRIAEVSIRAGDAIKKDPIVINFDTASAVLTDKKMSFDIDSDGKSDQVSTLAAGSGFLAIDINNDGKINDGSELFGTKSQNGFADLAKYDLDKNNWIDENDRIFDKLRIWTKDEAGKDTLFALGEKGIGAIYLGNISSSFLLKNDQNQEQGQIQKTGIFVKENGIVGTLQHLDLVV